MLSEIINFFADYWIKLIKAFAYGSLFCTYCYYMKLIHVRPWERKLKEENKKRLGNKLFLHNMGILMDRNKIVELGRKAISCDKTKIIFSDPIVMSNGVTVERQIKPDRYDQNMYENRTLKEFINGLRELKD